tara:strand:- start:60 stop:1142 length:1083 start_codon:yes stop_codon:yes gene_type:complete
MAIYRGTGGAGDSTTDATVTEVTTQATNAAISAAEALTSASSASTSATSATNSATTATTKASEANTSASNAATSETNAGNSATAAASSASSASTSASTATTKASEASTSATNAAASYDDFDDRYLGAKASAPTVDNDGDALITGALYFNTVGNKLQVWTGTVWGNIEGDEGFVELNDLTSSVTWANVPDANITQGSVTQHQAALSVTESQISDLQSYLTSETNNLSTAVTWANVPDANITQSSVTQHQAALSITESQISDLAHTTALPFSSITSKPTTLTGYGITDAATSAQGALADSAVQPSTSPTFVTVNATTVDLGDWTITEAGGVLKFAHSGTDKMKLDSSGNLTVVGDVTAFGSI